MTQSRWLRRVGLLVALAAVYFIAGRLGLNLAFVNASATPVWPCTGIAFAAFVLLGYDVWPAVLAGSVLVNITTAGSAATAIGIAVGNTLEGVAGAYLVNRFARGRRAFDRPPDVFAGVSVLSVPHLGRVPVRATRGRERGRGALGDRHLGHAARVRSVRAGDAQRVAPAAAGVHGRHVGDDARARRPRGRALAGGGAAAAAGSERSADGPRQLPPAHLCDRRGDQAVPADRAAVRRGAAGYGRLEEDQRQPLPPGGEPGAVPRGGDAVRIVPGDGHGRAVRR